MQNTPKIYNILHFRLGDEMLVRNQTINFTHFKNKVQENYEQNDIFMSDTKDFKSYINREYPNIFQFNIEIGHTGLESNIKDTFFEFIIVTRSQKIKTYTANNHKSGFVKIANEIYNVDLIDI